MPASREIVLLSRNRSTPDGRRVLMSPAATRALFRHLMVGRVFVIMPAFNAGRTIESVFDRIPPAARARISRYVIVDDGSTDDTQSAIARLAARIPGLVSLRHEVNRGYGAAEKTLLDHAVSEGAEVAILLHSDGQYSPEKIPEMLGPFDRDEADLVQGSRMLQPGALSGGMPVYKFVANKALTALANRAFGMRMAEYYSGYMAYSRKALLAIPYSRLGDSFHFDLEMLVLARVKGLRIAQVAIPTIYAGEVSHLRPIKYGLDVLSVIRDYRRGRYHRY
jgi:glycosyltransferase involved in cell wall biosynthesis